MLNWIAILKPKNEWDLSWKIRSDLFSLFIIFILYDYSVSILQYVASNIVTVIR
jgi:hypothetical protein